MWFFFLSLLIKKKIIAGFVQVNNQPRNDKMLQSEDCLCSVVSFLTVLDTLTIVRLVSSSWCELFSNYLPQVKLSLRHYQILPYLELANIRFFTNRFLLKDEHPLGYLAKSVECMRLNACWKLTRMDFSSFVKLRVLILDNCQFTPVALPPVLEKLHMNDCSGYLDPLLSKLPQSVHTLSLKLCTLDTPEVKHQLTQLVLMGCIGLDNQSLSSLLTSTRKGLRKLEIKDCEVVTDEGVSGLHTSAPFLSKLVVNNTDITDASLRQFAQLRKLQQLDIANNHRLTPTGLHVLGAVSKVNISGIQGGIPTGNLLSATVLIYRHSLFGNTYYLPSRLEVLDCCYTQGTQSRPFLRALRLLPHLRKLCIGHDKFIVDLPLLPKLEQLRIITPLPPFWVWSRYRLKSLHWDACRRAARCLTINNWVQKLKLNVPDIQITRIQNLIY
jgi:hypothetical protein